MAARDEILYKLRTTLAQPDLRFPPPEPQPLTAEARMTVTHADGDVHALAARFGRELETLYGTFEIVGSPAEARLATITKLLAWRQEEETGRKGVQLVSGQEQMVLSWAASALPVSGLADALADMGLQVVVPARLDTQESRDAIRSIPFGLTGVEAAFASTGSILVASGRDTSRVASLLPLRHLALIPFSLLYPTMEAWLAQMRAQGLSDALRSHAHVAMITGPSKSADIEMNLTLGVHGPKFIHAILFNDIVS